MPDPLDEFLEETEIMEENGTSRPRQKMRSGMILDLLSCLLMTGTIALVLLFIIIFINPQSRLNPLPPITMPDGFVTYSPSSTPKAVLPPTWTPTISTTDTPVWTPTKSPTDTPALTPLPTETLMSIVQNILIPKGDLENGVTFSRQNGSPTPEANTVSIKAGCNMLGSAEQVYDMDGQPGNTQLVMRLTQSQVTSGLTAPTPIDQFRARALPPDDGISDLFTLEIQYWEEEIMAWAEEYGLDPNLIATVMQIESCGYTRAKSAAGAMGLFQVMPQHFREKEDPYDPDTNAYRGLRWLQKTLKSGGSTRMALACYNAGIARIKNPYLEWPNETERYVNWGLNIYQDTECGYDYSLALHHWLSKGGSSLCNRAAEEQQGK
mgnify:CR=1 FL=1